MGPWTRPAIVMKVGFTDPFSPTEDRCRFRVLRCDHSLGACGGCRHESTRVGRGSAAPAEMPPGRVAERGLQSLRAPRAHRPGDRRPHHHLAHPRPRARRHQPRHQPRCRYRRWCRSGRGAGGGPVLSSVRPDRPRRRRGVRGLRGRASTRRGPRRPRPRRRGGHRRVARADRLAISRPLVPDLRRRHPPPALSTNTQRTIKPCTITQCTGIVWAALHMSNDQEAGGVDGGSQSPLPGATAARDTRSGPRSAPRSCGRRRG